MDQVIFYLCRIYFETISHIWIPIALKKIIITYSSTIFQSNILHYNQDIKLFNLLSNLSIGINPKLLYRASAHLFDKTKFHQLCDEHGPTMKLLKVKMVTCLVYMLM